MSLDDLPNIQKKIIVVLSIYFKNKKRLTNADINELQDTHYQYLEEISGASLISHLRNLDFTELIDVAAKGRKIAVKTHNQKLFDEAVIKFKKEVGDPND